ncbi:MAG: hypothetical protein IPK98_10175 [Chloracidobacterium sp.]|nr:hypothetical protein [Chloracidobacterium sp.]
MSSTGVLAQYKGNPVKKEKLVKVIRMKQLSTREIVAVIKTNGVDFKVTAHRSGSFPVRERGLRSSAPRLQITVLRRFKNSPLRHRSKPQLRITTNYLIRGITL